MMSPMSEPRYTPTTYPAYVQVCTPKAETHCDQIRHFGALLFALHTKGAFKKNIAHQGALTESRLVNKLFYYCNVHGVKAFHPREELMIRVRMLQE
jgi:hypothetical protein